MTAITTNPGFITIGPATRRVSSRPTLRRNARFPVSQVSRSRVSRAIYLRRRLTVAVLALGLVVMVAQAGSALGGDPSHPPSALHLVEQFLLSEPSWCAPATLYGR